MTSHTVIPTMFTKSSLYSIAMQSAIILNDIEGFKHLLNMESESLSKDQRYALAYLACIGSHNKSFLHCLIFDYNLNESLINPLYITDEVKMLFAKRTVQELNKELSVNDSKDKNMKI